MWKPVIASGKAQSSHFFASFFFLPYQISLLVSSHFPRLNILNNAIRKSFWNKLTSMFFELKLTLPPLLPFKSEVKKIHYGSNLIFLLFSSLFFFSSHYEQYRPVSTFKFSPSPSFSLLLFVQKALSGTCRRTCCLAYFQTLLSHFLLNVVYFDYPLDITFPWS